MPRAPSPTRAQIRLRFGGGLNTRSVETDINPIECTNGQNFDLDLSSTIFRRRKPFDLVNTADNGERINGFMQLQKVDGTLTTLVQAGGTVYTWDGQNNPSSVVGTVHSGARLRGPLSQNWLLTDVALITDLNKVQPVMSWDGATLSEMSHDLGGKFYAKYLVIDNERALFGNVKSGTDTPHLLVGSARTDHTTLGLAGVSTRAQDGDLGVADAWFLPMLDNRPINGLVAAFGLVAISTVRGRVLKLTGSDATDFAINPLHSKTGARGDEAFVYVGNDIFIGDSGKIESLVSTDRFADVETDDISREIRNLVEGIDDWNLVYNSRSGKVYCSGASNSDLFVYHKALRDERFLLSQQSGQAPPRISPWSRWRTDTAVAFQPTCLQTILRPTDGKEVTYMGGTAGQIYQLEGSGGQDAGADDVEVNRVTAVIPTPKGGPLFKVSGWISYRRRVAATVTLTFEWGGRTQSDEVITVPLDAADNQVFYGGNFYYGGTFYYGTKFEGRLALQNIAASGRGDQLQVKIAFDGSVDVEINEILLDFETT